MVQVTLPLPVVSCKIVSVGIYRNRRIDRIKLSILQRMCAHPLLWALGTWMFFGALSLYTRFWKGLAVGAAVAVVLWLSLRLSRKQLPELHEVAYGGAPPEA